MYLAMRLSIRIWFEWIDSKDKPADGLSREGALDSVYGGVALEGLSPGWHFMAVDTARFAEIASRYGS